MTDVKLIKIYKQLHIAALLTLVFIATTWALLRSDFFTFHDYTQGARIVEMATALQDGHFPPIWSQNLGFGYGMPVFEFYAPLPYYITGIFYALGLNLITSVKLLFFIPALVTLVGGFLLGRKLYGSLGGLLVSAALMLAPYRAVNLFVRGALSEIWGLSMVPLILYGGIKVIRNEKYGWITLVGSILGLLLSHNLTALMFLPFSIVFLGAYLLHHAYSNSWGLKDIFCKILHFSGYYFLSFVLSAYYTIPALLEKDFTRLDATILAEYFDYNNHFLFIRQFFQDRWAYGGSTFGPQDDISFYLGFGQIVALVILSYLLLNTFFQLYKRRKTVSSALLAFGTRFWTVVLMSSVLLSSALLLTTQKTVFIWNAVPALEFLQFPWRFLNVAVVFLAIVIGGIVVATRNKVIRYIFTIVVLTLILFNYRYFEPQEFLSLDEAQTYFYSEEMKLRTDMSTTLPDYIPVGIQEEVPDLIPEPGQYFYCELSNTCNFEYTILVDKVQEKSFEVTSESEQEIMFTIADYPGWSVFLNDRKIDTMTNSSGLVTILVPAGTNQVTVKLLSSEVRQYSQFLSFAGIASVLLLSTLEQRRKQRDVKN